MCVDNDMYLISFPEECGSQVTSDTTIGFFAAIFRS
jgi:hypothetical protein